ncbi:MAG: PEP-CTERM sorting domain-containing protein [Gemmatimonadaceae bacterium]|jgi:hypothetical protein|nr:PEP-CTERM sorting domain-containing protein [Gemmatimonadaceae bacterium]
MPRSFAIRSALVAAAVLSMRAEVVRAQLVDFTQSPSGFTAPNPNNFIGFGVWTHQPGTGWIVNGRNRERATLLSPTFTATGGAAGIDLRHSFNFQLSLFGGCFDGGLLRASVDGGAFQTFVPQTSPGSLGYRGAIGQNGGNPLAGEPAFCGFPNNQQGTVVQSLFLRPLTAGQRIQFAFEAGWDNSTVNPGANWTLDRVQLVGLAPATVVPEPSTVALLGVGVLGIGVFARQRRARVG